MKKDKFIDIPYLPVKKVTLVLIDERTSRSIKKKLHDLDIDYIENPAGDYPYSSISGHPDIFVHPLGGKKLLLAPNSSTKLQRQLLQHDFEILMGNTSIESNYPYYTAYNIARIGMKAFHFWKYTDSTAIEQLTKQGIEKINVKQGYAKCAVSIVSENALISSDIPICNMAQHKGMKVLNIKPGYIELNGLNYGFIGGATGLISKSKLAFAGELGKHPEGERIRLFLKRNGIEAVSLSREPLIDIGSIIPLKESI